MVVMEGSDISLAAEILRTMWIQYLHLQFRGPESTSSSRSQLQNPRHNSLQEPSGTIFNIQIGDPMMLMFSAFSNPILTFTKHLINNGGE